MRQITLNVKESYYAKFIQLLRTLTDIEIAKEETLTVAPVEQQLHNTPKKKKFTVVKVMAADRNYTFNREELNAR